MATEQVRPDREVNIEEAEKYDKELKYRSFASRWPTLLVAAIAVSLALYHLYTAAFPLFSAHQHRALPIYTLPAVEDPDLVACPIVGMAIDTREHASDWHAHQRTQLLYQAEGGVTLYLADRVGQLAPLQAAWLPAGCVHRTAMQGSFAYRSLYFDVRAYPNLPREPAILDVNPLLRELIVRVTQWPSDAALDAPRQRLVGALLDELAAAPTAPLHLPMPRDRRLAPIARELLENPACPLSIDEWGRRVGASGRTLARVFLAETGLSFTRWRAQCRLLMARARLAEGASVTEVAHAVGYASDSAFIAMYRRAYGEPPGRRLRRRDPPP